VFLSSTTAFLDGMDWLTLIFWTCDMMQGFFLGYYTRDGKYVCSRRAVLAHYLRTWFSVDVLVVGPDWTVRVLVWKDQTMEIDENNAGDLGKILKAARAIRVMRLLRLLKLQRIVHAMYDMIESEYWFVVVNLTQLLLFVLVLNHVIACVWYSIGVHGMQRQQRNWIEVSNTNDFGLWFRYTTSLHWSLTQFTPASMDVSARNIQERTFSIIVLFFAMVAFSSIVGSITASTTQLRDGRKELMHQSWLLRRYLRQREVTKDLTLRITKYLDHQHWKANRFVQDKKLAILNGLSDALYNELNYQVHSPYLVYHPYFQYLRTSIKVCLQKICRFSIKLQSYADSEIVFNNGDVAQNMFFIRSGTVDYIRPDGSELQPPLEEKEWFSEPVLWTEWRHQGTMSAQVDCELFVVDPTVFATAVCGHPTPFEFTRRYAFEFVIELNTLNREDITDVLRHSKLYAFALKEGSKSKCPPGGYDLHSQTANFDTMALDGHNLMVKYRSGLPPAPARVFSKEALHLIKL